MFSQVHDQYILLHQNPRSHWSLDKKAVLIIGCLVIPVVLFCATYMILFGIFEKLMYPRSSMNSFISTSTLQRDLHRASAYNTFNIGDSFSEIHPNPHEAQDISSFKLVCYYNLPSNADSLQIKDIDPYLCSHLNVAFASVVNNTLYLEAKDIDYLKEVVEMKKVNKNLKVLLTVGGAYNDMGFPEMVLNHTNRKMFIKSVISYVKDYGIDGIDLDWEFPGAEPIFDKYQRMHFTQLLYEFRKTISKHPNLTFLVTLAVAAPVQFIEVSYDVSYLNDYVDYINLMTYDFHFYTKETPFTGINSPLYPSSLEKNFLATLNINYSSHYWNFSGMDKSKIIIGLPTYAHSFRLINPRNRGLYSPASGYGKLGLLGFASYPQVCNFLQVNHITPIFDMETLSPYASKYYEWVSFDDEQSLTYKTEYIKNNNFGGAMIYSLNADDFKGVCKMGTKSGAKFPLVSTIKKVLEAKILN